MREHGLEGRQFLIALASSALLLGLPLWMLLDRSPPYVRDHGQIIAAAPENCGLPPGPASVTPGACVAVVWSVRIIRNCVPSEHSNITRRIVDGENVAWPIAAVAGLYGTGTLPSSSDRLVRYLVLPSGAAPGRAIYKSSASYACNPLQRLVWPVVVDTPDITFVIEEFGSGSPSPRTQRPAPSRLRRG